MAIQRVSSNPGPVFNVGGTSRTKQGTYDAYGTNPDGTPNVQTVIPNNPDGSRGDGAPPLATPGTVVITYNPGTPDETTVTVDQNETPEDTIEVAWPGLLPADPFTPVNPGTGRSPPGAINPTIPRGTITGEAPAPDVRTGGPRQPPGGTPLAPTPGDTPGGRPDDAEDHQREPGPDAIPSDRTAVPRPVDDVFDLRSSLAAAQKQAIDAAQKTRNRLKFGGRKSTIGAGFQRGSGTSSSGGRGSVQQFEPGRESPSTEPGSPGSQVGRQPGPNAIPSDRIAVPRRTRIRRR